MRSFRSIINRKDGQFFLNAFKFAEKWGFDSLKTTLFGRLHSPNIGTPIQVIYAARLLGIEKSKSEVLVKPFMAIMKKPPSDEEFQLMRREDLITLCQLQAYGKNISDQIKVGRDGIRKYILVDNVYIDNATMGQEGYVRAVIVGGVMASDIEMAKARKGGTANGLRSKTVSQHPKVLGGIVLLKETHLIYLLVSPVISVYFLSML